MAADGGAGAAHFILYRRSLDRQVETIILRPAVEAVDQRGQTLSGSEDITGQNADIHLLYTLAGALKGNIMITDRQGNIVHCIGMGMDMKNVTGAKINVVGHHDLPWSKSDLQSIMQGETVSYRGAYHFLDTDVLTVAVPFYKEGQSAGTVMLSSPWPPLKSVSTPYRKAIARQIIEAHGGTIGVSSKPGKGSTFYFAIPK